MLGRKGAVFVLRGCDAEAVVTREDALSCRLEVCMLCRAAVVYRRLACRKSALEGAIVTSGVKVRKSASSLGGWTFEGEIIMLTS